MKRLIEHHHILVLPYIEASQSGILTIALDANMPMVLSDLPGLREQLPEDAAVWCHSDPQSLKEGIEKYKHIEKYNSVKTNMEAYKKHFQQTWFEQLESL